MYLIKGVELLILRIIDTRLKKIPINMFFSPNIRKQFNKRDKKTVARLAKTFILKLKNYRATINGNKDTRIKLKIINLLKTVFSVI